MTTMFFVSSQVGIQWGFIVVWYYAYNYILYVVRSESWLFVFSCVLGEMCSCYKWELVVCFQLYPVWVVQLLYIRAGCLCSVVSWVSCSVVISESWLIVFSCNLGSFSVVISESWLFVFSCILGELFSKRTMFKAPNEMELLNVISKMCGTPCAAVWPGVTRLPLWPQFKTRKIHRRKIKEEFSLYVVLQVDLNCF